MRPEEMELPHTDSDLKALMTSTPYVAMMVGVVLMVTNMLLLSGAPAGVL